MKTLLGVDVGTTSLKMVLFDENGKALMTVSKAYTLDTRGDRVEFDPEQYWQMFSDAYAQIRAQHPVTALAIDTQCETLIVTDAQGKALYNAIVWLDNRATAEAEAIDRAFGVKKVYEVTGQPEITATWPACKLLWLRNNEPEIFGKIKKVFLLEDYLLYRLTGQFVTEKTLQSSSLYLDIVNGCWWKEMLSFIGVSESQLPRLCASGECIGTFDGVQVITGVMDQIAGAIGAGVTDRTITSEMTGTTMAIVAPTDAVPAYQEGSRVPCHVNFDGGYCLLTWTPTAGIAQKWFRDNFCEGMNYGEMGELAAAVNPGCDGLTFLPYLCGSIIPKYNPDARGAFMGLTMEHTRGHFIRAIQESVAFMLKEHLQYLGVECTQIRSTGGGAASELWCQIKADVTGKRIVTLKNPESACLGSAIVAGYGAGIYESIHAASCRLVQTDRVYEPSGTDYTEAFDRYMRYEEEYV